MSMLIFVLASLLMIILPLLAAAGVFSIALPWWTERVLKSDPRVHERLQLEVSEESIAWAIASDGSALQPLPYALLTWAVLAAIVVTAIEAAVFAVSSRVPDLWLISGAIAAAAVIVLTVLTAWLFKNRLRRLVDRELDARANQVFSFADQTLFETWWTARQIDRTFASLGLEARSDALDDGRRAVLAHARLGRDSALAEAIGIKHKAEQDLRSLDDLARLLATALTVLAQAKSDVGDVEGLREAVAQIEDRIKSPDLAGALADGRWVDARGLLDKISSDLGKVLDLCRDEAMPESAEDAYRFLNVGDETPLDNIKAVVTAYRRVWHPDLARDELERQERNLRIQQINVAWDIIQKARAGQTCVG
jgi:hypothetical protein